MTTPAKTDLKDEINLAVHAILNHSKDLFWTSLAVISEYGQLDWKSEINSASKYWKRSDKTLETRLRKLEDATLKTGSQSMGELSKLCFQYCKEDQPYISSFQNTNYRLLVPKDAVIEQLKECSPCPLVDSKSEREAYAKAAMACMPEGSGGVLVPLVQTHENRTLHVGVIVICASKNSDIWDRLPQIKATAVALLESKRTLHGLAGNPVDNIVHKLFFKILQKFHLKDGLFAGSCAEPCGNVADCAAKISADKLRHTHGDCRLASDAHFRDVFVFAEASLKFQKELFDWRIVSNKPCSRSRLTGHFPVSELKDFLTKKNAFVKFTVDESVKCMSWPTTPGALSLICILQLYATLAGSSDGKGCSITEVKLEKSCKGCSLHWIFQFSENPGDLAMAWSDSVGATGRTPGDIVRAINRAIRGEPDFEGFDGMPEPVRAACSENIQPVMFPFFDLKAKQLHLIMPQSDCGNECKNGSWFPGAKIAKKEKKS